MTKSFAVGILLFLVSFALYWSLPVFAEEAAADAKSSETLASKVGKEKLPVNVTSDRMISDNKTNLITFTGNVKVVRGDATLLAEKIVVQRGAGGKGIDTITATENVRVVQGEKHATGDKGVYYDAEKTIVLSGNVKSWEKENLITGNEMTYFLDTEKVVVRQGEKSQVHVDFYPEKK